MHESHASPAGLAAAAPEPRPPTKSHKNPSARCIYVCLNDMDGPVRALARQEEVTVSQLVRRALQALLPPIVEPQATEGPQMAAGDKAVRVQVMMRPRHQRLMNERARAAGMFNGEYLGALMTGTVPAALPGNYDAQVATLMMSTDQLAASSVDLNVSLRHLRQAPSGHLTQFIADLQVCIAEVRSHMAMASQLAADLHHTRRRS